MADIYDRLNGRNINDLNHRELFELVIIVLLKPGPDRDQKELDILIKYVEDMEFLTKLKAEKNYETLYNLCKHFEYESFAREQIVFEEGSLGTKFYIILQGKVEVLIKSNNPFSTSNYIPVADMTAGKSFGELAIMDDALKPRKATIRCIEHTHFAVLSRKSFQSFLGHVKKEFEAQVEAFTANSLFSRNKWSNRLLDQWVKSFTQMGNLQRNAVLYKEGDPSEYLYFIRSGQVKNTKKIIIDRPSNIQKDIILDERNQIFQVEHAKMHKEVEIAVWGDGMLFGEEETFQVFKHERQLERERDRFKKEFQDRFEEERNKMEAIGYRYKPPKELMIPEDPNDDEKVIEQLLDMKIASLTQGSNKRETTVTVVSHSAEIWMIPRNLFFTQLETNWTSIKELEMIIHAKQKRRKERLEEYMNYLTKNVDYISVQKSSIMNKNIVSVIKQKRFHKVENSNKVIFKEDPNYNSLVRSFKAVKEELKKQMPSSPGGGQTEKIILETNPSNFPFDEMQEKSSISFYPNEDYLEMFPPPEEPEKKEVFPARPNTSVQGQANPRRTRGMSEPVNIYNSFFSQLPETKFNKFIGRKSKMYVDDKLNSSVQSQKQQRSQTPNPITRKVEESNHRSATPNITKTPPLKGYLIVENPLRGLNYTASLPYEEKKFIGKSIQRGYRISSQDTQISDVLDPEQFLKDRMDVKKLVSQRIENSSPPRPRNEENDRFFTPANMKVSDENFVDIFRTTTRLLKMPVHEPRITPRPKPRPSTSNAARTHAANAEGSVSKSTNIKKSASRVLEDEPSYRIHEIHSRPKSVHQSERPKDKQVINTSIELTPIREDIRFISDDFFTSKRGNNSPYSAKFDASRRDLATYSENFSPSSIDKATLLKETMLNSQKFERIEKHQETEFKKVANNRSASVPESRIMTPLQKYRERYAHGLGKTITQSDQPKQEEPSISPTKDLMNKLAKSQVHYKAPKFITKHRALSIQDSNIFNRKPLNDKSHLLPSRRASDTESVDMFRKKPKKKKNFVVEGRKERFSKSVRKVRGH